MTCERRKTTQNKEINGGFLSTWGIMLPILEHIIAKSNRSKVDYKGQAHMVANTEPEGLGGEPSASDFRNDYVLDGPVRVH